MSSSTRKCTGNAWQSQTPLCKEQIKCRVWGAGWDSWDQVQTINNLVTRILEVKALAAMWIWVHVHWYDRTPHLHPLTLLMGRGLGMRIADGGSLGAGVFLGCLGGESSTVLHVRSPPTQPNTQVDQPCGRGWGSSLLGMLVGCRYLEYF